LTSARRIVAAASAAAQLRPRQERQAVEIVALAIGGDLDRAGGLAAEHVAEFPNDDLARAVHAALSENRET
jgi:hypothetical protein